VFAENRRNGDTRCLALTAHFTGATLCGAQLARIALTTSHPAVADDGIHMVKPQDEEELGDLPPMDGDLDGEDDAGEVADKNLEMPLEDGPLDDEVARDLSPEEALVPIREDGASWLNEEPDAPDLDLGTGAVLDLGKEAPPSEDEAPGDLGEDADLWDDSAEVALDGGDEGPLAADEELRDEDLPALDADDEGEGEDAAFVDDRFAPDEPLGLPWAARPWPRVGAPLGLTGATAVACAGRFALVALRAETDDSGARRPSELVQVDLEGSYATLSASGFKGPDVEILANDGTDSGTVAMVLRGGRLVTSADGGAHFEADAHGIAAAGCIVALGRVWVRTQTSSLITLTAGVLEGYSLPGAVTAIASNGAEAVAALLTAGEGKPRAIARFGSGGSLTVEQLDEAEDDGREQTEPRERVVLAARAGCVAYSVRGGITRRAADGTWRRFAGWEGRVTALAFVDDGGTLLVAAYSDLEDTTGLVRIDGAGRLSVVARIGAMRDHGESDGRVLSLAWDDARGVVWLAGGFGVAAFSID